MAESNFARRVYNASPPLVQDMLATVAGYRRNAYRFGDPRFAYWENHYHEQLGWPEDRLRDYQWDAFLGTLKHAYQTVPFYRDKFGECGITPDDIRTPEDVVNLPFTDKGDVCGESDRIISEAYDRTKLNRDPTGGSTGLPLRLYNCREAVMRNYAVRWAQCRPGITRDMRYGNFTGVEIVRPECSRPPYWRTNYAGHQRLYSIFHMNDESLAHYVENLNRFGPEWLYGFPSALYTVADFIDRKNLSLDFSLKAIVTSSEQLLDRYRELIERVFKTVVWDEYGQAEFVGLAFQCECGKLHENISYSFVEFVATGEEEDGFPCFELVCTSTINPAWPLIRYRVGDIVLMDPAAQCPYGRPGRIIERIHGRTGQFLETSDGRKISNITSMARNCRNIKSCQAVQERPGEMVLRIVKDCGFTESDAELMVKEFRKKLGDESKMKIRVDHAEAPLLTQNGKFLLILSKQKSLEFAA